MQYIIILNLHYIIQIFSGITCGRVLNGEKSENSMKHSVDKYRKISFCNLCVLLNYYNYCILASKLGCIECRPILHFL